ncbi:MAG: hypothetical protein H0U86_19050 [Chloroflexi bacterium]|nr:hypothetical protein [Chloroflexota bacterium]
MHELAAVAWRAADLRALKLEEATPANHVLPPDWTETREARAAMKAWKRAQADAEHAWNAFTSALCCLVDAEQQLAPEQEALDF